MRDNLGEKAATIWMGIGGRGLTILSLIERMGRKSKVWKAFQCVSGPKGPAKLDCTGGLVAPRQSG